MFLARRPSASSVYQDSRDARWKSRPAATAGRSRECFQAEAPARAPDTLVRSSHRCRAVSAGRAVPWRPAAEPRSSAPAAPLRYRASGCRSSRAAEVWMSSIKMFLYLDLQGSCIRHLGATGVGALKVQSVLQISSPGVQIRKLCRKAYGVSDRSTSASPIMGQNDQRSPIMNPALLPRALTAGLVALAMAISPAS